MTGNFLERWSKLKRETAADERPDRPQDQGAQPPVLSASEIQELIKSLPDIGTLTHESDFSIFMQGWVPEDMRREALRRLWTVDKSVLEHVPLADYALDYNTPGAAPGYGLMTASAEMVADVARMMGKAAFPDKVTVESDDSATDAQPENESAVLSQSEQAEETVEKIEISVAEEELTLPIGQFAQQENCALREVVEEPPAFTAGRRRHGAAAPR